MLAQLLMLLADAAPSGGGTTAPGQGNDPLGGLGFFLPMAAILILGYLLMIRPMRRDEAARKAMASNLKKNDRVLTGSGIYGTVVSVSDSEDEVVLRIDDNARMRIIKSAVARNLTQEEAAKAPQEQKQAK